jgi:PucR C-terminal helix-turn-helix domain/GGDEF-like domain
MILTRLPAAAVLAAADARVRASLLGDYLDVLADVVTPPSGLPDGSAAGRRVAPAELRRFRSLGRAAAEAGTSLKALVDLYLSATWRVWPTLPAIAAQADVATLRAAGVAVLRASDDVVAALCEGYEEARHARVVAEDAGRRELIDDLLTGTSDIGTLIERAAAYGLLLEARHIVLVAHADRRFRDGKGITRDVEAGLLTRLEQRAGLLVATKDGLLVCVVPAEGDPARAGTTVWSDIVATRLGRQAGMRWRIGVSRARAGLGGVRAGFEEARRTVDVATMLDLPDRVVHAEDLLVYQVLLRDRPALEELVTTVLTPLLEARGGPQPLLDTLEAYFATGGVTLAAARRLHLSPRAFTYRLERITELTGHDPRSPDARFALQTATLGARLLRWPPTTPAEDESAPG